jgi:hypothetical protein
VEIKVDSVLESEIKTESSLEQGESRRRDGRDAVELSRRFKDETAATLPIH